ncbi:MAG: TonB family protein [Candidatus Melainabacteria bacterium]|nr:TonB family protein [Candidatus Melainabacteria bacterium]
MSGGAAQAQDAFGYGPSYADELCIKIGTSWSPPKSLTSYDVVTRFDINRAGEVANLRVVSSSGDLGADAAAFAAISSLSPLFHRPIGSEDEEIHYDRFVFSFTPQPSPEIVSEKEGHAWKIKVFSSRI